MTNPRALRIMALLAALLFVAGIAIMIGSWILGALMPSAHQASLLTGEGIRWMFRHMAKGLLSPLLAWIVIAGISWGLAKRSGLGQPALKSHRGRMALMASSGFLLLYIIIIIMLTVPSHAVLLSSTGSLFPSAFSEAIIPLVCLGIALFSVVFGIASGEYTGIESLFDAAVEGIRWAAPVIVVYIFAIQCWNMLIYVLN